MSTGTSDYWPAVMRSLCGKFDDRTWVAEGHGGRYGDLLRVAGWRTGRLSGMRAMSVPRAVDSATTGWRSRGVDGVV